MTDKIEKAIKDTESAFDLWEEDRRCPGEDWSDIHESMDLAIAALKAQDPRVMTYEEVLFLKFDDVVYFEVYQTKAIFSSIVIRVIPRIPDIEIGVVQFRQAAGYNGIYNAELSCYGETWRCWTSRPTEAQREATSWD